jgi:hypothetical protein
VCPRIGGRRDRASSRRASPDDCYDGLGRLHGAQTTGTASYPFTYGYNAAGSVTSMTYPSSLIERRIVLRQVHRLP